LAKNIKLAAKEVLGSCISIGVTVDGKDPREVQKGIDDGLYDEMFSKSEA
jgi:large subunit ribosomal protein L11